ncbi:hypothetical protein [Desulfobacterium sp. N47]|uniref:Response regulatory domain-containing protein n=1 Tax=uncultured Desulfobacterium sp. TaxID=201089 RepID=E1YI70_9BACT|nr:unknown protein [uncultured Desulfobacterium sp.]
MTKPKEEKKAFVITRDSDFRKALIPSLGELDYSITVQEELSDDFSVFENGKTAALVIIDLNCSEMTDSEFFGRIQKC